MSKQQIGVVGMAVMGRNLALNIESVAIPFLFLTVHQTKPTKWLPRIQVRIWCRVIPLKSLLIHWKTAPYPADGESG